MHVIPAIAAPHNVTLAEDLADASTALPARMTCERVYERLDQTRRYRRNRHRLANPLVRYNRYIKRMAHDMFGGCASLSNRSCVTLSDFTAEMFEMLAEQAGHMVRTAGRRTLGSWDVEQAMRLVLGRDLAQDADAFAKRKLAEYEASVGRGGGGGGDDNACPPA